MIIAVLTVLTLLTDSAAVVVQSSLHLFQSAFCLSSAPDGRLFVIDQKKHSVYEISSGDSISRTVGGQGWGNYEFDVPTDVASSFLLDLFVVDKNNNRIQRFDKQLNYLHTYDERSLPHIEGRFQPQSCALSSLGDLFIIERDGKRILKLTPRVSLEHEFGTYKEGKGAIADPRDIDVTANDEVVVLDKSSIVLFDLFGNFLRRIVLSGSDDWRSVHVSPQAMLAVSSSKIIVFYSDPESSRIIVPSFIIGAKINEPFADALILNDTLIIITATTLYRCSIP